MATSFNLQEYILFRVEIKRELTNAEVDTNFQMVSNPWVTSRVYEIGNIVYHPVIVDDPTTTGEDQVLAWWRANVRTTQGVFDTSEWDIIGGIGSGTINVQGANSFGRINVNSTAPTGALQSGYDALLTSSLPNDKFNLIAGAGMSLHYNIASKSIVLVNTLASNPGEINAGGNIGTGVGYQNVYAGKVGLNLQFYGFQTTNTTNVAGNALTISTNAASKNIEHNFNEGNVNLAALNGGAPTIGMLSNVLATAPNPLDFLQWNSGSGKWVPTAISSLGYTFSSGLNESSGSVKLGGALTETTTLTTNTHPFVITGVGGVFTHDTLGVRFDILNRTFRSFSKNFQVEVNDASPSLYLRCKGDNFNVAANLQATSSTETDPANMVSVDVTYLPLNSIRKTIVLKTGPNIGGTTEEIRINGASLATTTFTVADTKIILEDLPTSADFGTILSNQLYRDLNTSTDSSGNASFLIRIKP